jgi:cleavage stimulation factor subunit 3
MDQLRKTYHRAIVIPLENIEKLWKDYDAFENGLSRMTAKKFIADRSAAYMTARLASREIKNLLDPMDRILESWYPKPPIWNDNDKRIVELWRQYLKWERSNPVHLDDGSLFQRILYCYKSSLIPMRHYPEFW